MYNLWVIVRVSQSLKTTTLNHQTQQHFYRLNSAGSPITAHMPPNGAKSQYNPPQVPEPPSYPLIEIPNSDEGTSETEDQYKMQDRLNLNEFMLDSLKGKNDQIILQPTC